MPIDQESASLMDNTAIQVDFVDFQLVSIITIRDKSNLHQLCMDIMEENLEDNLSTFILSMIGKRILQRHEKKILCNEFNGRVQLLPI